MTDSYGWAPPQDYFALMEHDSNHSALRLATGSSRPSCTPCMHRRLVASGSATRTEASVSSTRGGWPIMRARQGPLSVLPRTGMELYGQAQPEVYGDSIIRRGSIS